MKLDLGNPINMYYSGKYAIMFSKIYLNFELNDFAATLDAVLNYESILE